MKILHCFPMADNQTGLFILKSFEQLGHVVEVVDSKIDPERTVAACEKFNPEWVFCARTEALLEPVKFIRKKYPKIKTTCWNVDKRESLHQFSSTLLKLFNSVHIYYTVGNCISAYNKICPNTITKHMQQGCDPEIHKIETLTKEDHQKYDCDVLFAGSAGPIHRGRKALINYLKDKDFSFKHIGAIGATKIYDSEHNCACTCAKICLSNNGFAKVDTSMSVRVYKIMAAGGFLLEEYCPGIENWFKIGIECDVYHTKEECLEKIRYYLKHPDKRQAIASNGCKVVHEKHKYIDRIKMMIDDVQNLKL